jgi:serine/threonine protein kinase
MSRHDKTQSAKPLVDEYGNIHYPSEELARGGQGVVFRTTDADLAIKQPLDVSGNPDKNANLRDRFQNIRLLPLPPRIPISLPLAILRNEPGYVMRLLNGMKPFEAFEMNGTTHKTLREAIEEGKLECPKWLAKIPDQKMRLRLLHYARTGSTLRRLFALSKCAAILARLHSFGLVYGDISPKNVFIGDGNSREVWLIDADNLRFEMSEGGNAVYTPHYGAPEIVQGRDQARPRTDCWAFAVMAFSMLTISHPFIGKKVLEPGDDEGGWDAEPAGEGASAGLDEKAYAGHLPFVDDEDDDSNVAVTCPPLPRELVATSALRRFFQETFGAGRTQPHRRPAMAFWAIELARALDRSLVCSECRMSYFADNYKRCPYCDMPRPAFVRAKTKRWEVLIPATLKESTIPHRLFNPFSLEHHDDTECEAVLNFMEKSAKPIRGTKPFPPELSFEFVEAEK